MKKLFIITSLSFIIISLFLFSSCESCVKKMSKKATELTISAAEGVAEAVDEHGEALAEKTTNAAGKIMLGTGRSLSKQLDEHATKVAEVGGKTLVQTIDGLADGANSEIETHYDNIPYTEDFISGVALDFIGKYKDKPIIDTYFIMTETGTYTCNFEFADKDNKIFLTKDATLIKTDNNSKYLLVSFALNSQEDAEFKNLSNVKITVMKK